MLFAGSHGLQVGSLFRYDLWGGVPQLKVCESSNDRSQISSATRRLSRKTLKTATSCCAGGTVARHSPTNSRVMVASAERPRFILIRGLPGACGDLLRPRVRELSPPLSRKCPGDVSGSLHRRPRVAGTSGTPPVTPSTAGRRSARPRPNGVGTNHRRSPSADRAPAPAEGKSRHPLRERRAAEAVGSTRSPAAAASGTALMISATSSG